MHCPGKILHSHMPEDLKEDLSKNLKCCQIDTIRELVRGNPFMQLSTVRRSLKNFYQERHPIRKDISIRKGMLAAMFT